MTNEEYASLLSKAKDTYEKEVFAINYKYCIENSPYKVGDIVEDHIGYARINKISAPYFSLSRMPFCSYECDNLTRKFEVNKREPKRAVWQTNVKRKLQ